jgi:acetylglutamate kinase
VAQTSSEHFIVTKIGGKAAADGDLREALAADLTALRDRGRFILVHGGGSEVTDVARRFGIESVFRDGVRVTGLREMPIVDMVLAGRANKEWVRVLSRAGISACGISGADGNLIVGEPEPDSRTAHVRSVDAGILRTLCDAGYVPVIAPVSSDEDGSAVNVNADEVALALAEALSAEALLFLSDTSGVLRDGVPITELDADRAEQEIRIGTIHSGMIPKVRASVRAVANGVESISIGRYDRRGDIERLLSGAIGTRIVANEERT